MLIGSSGSAIRCFLTAPDGSGKYGLISSSSPNVLNVFGGILSGTQVAAG